MLKSNVCVPPSAALDRLGDRNMTANLFAALPAGSNIPMAMLLTKATIILLLALGMTVVMQRTSAGARHLVWLVTVAALLFVPALTAWGPLPVRILPALPSAADQSSSIIGSKSHETNGIKTDEPGVNAPSSATDAAPSGSVSNTA